MTLVRTRISISGFDEAEARGGLADLLDELRQRPWILRPEASWDAARVRLVVTLHYEGEDPEAGRRAALDECWDCVIACLDFSSEGIHFDVEDSAVIQDS